MSRRDGEDRREELLKAVNETEPHSAIGSYATFDDEYEARRDVWSEIDDYAKEIGIPIKWPHIPLLRACLHEAGHALAYLAHNVPFQSVHLWPRRISCQRPLWNGQVHPAMCEEAFEKLTPEIDASVSLGGPMAEVIVYGTATPCCFPDVWQVRRVQRENGWSGERVGGLVDQTRALLLARRGALGRVGRALAGRQHHHLWFHELRAIARFGAIPEWECQTREMQASMREHRRQVRANAAKGAG